MKRNYYSLSPSEKELPEEFYYGSMLVKRHSLEKDSKHAKRMVAIFESYVKAGIFPQNAGLIGDFLEHILVKHESGGREASGRYLGIAMPNGSYQYVRLEGESIGVVKTKLEPPEEIDILTDTCLFCAANATAVLETGETVSLVAPKGKIKSRVKELCILGHMCPYEVDAVTRLTDLIAAMKEGNGAYRKTVLAVPTIEYYFYLMDAYNSGFIDKAIMQEWIERVNRHAGEITRAISKRISHQIEICQPLQAAEPYIRDCVDSGHAADLDKVKEILSSKSGLWQEVLQVTKPKDWIQLNYTNYAISVLEPALLNGKPNRLMIDIENPSEQKILRNAAKIARKLGKQGGTDTFRAIGIYPHEKVFISISSEHSGSFHRLYYLEQNQVNGECFYRKIIEANRKKVIY